MCISIWLESRQQKFLEFSWQKPWNGTAIALWRFTLHYWCCHRAVEVYITLLVLPSRCGGLHYIIGVDIALWRFTLHYGCCHRAVKVYITLWVLPSRCRSLHYIMGVAIALWRFTLHYGCSVLVLSKNNIKINKRRQEYASCLVFVKC